MNKYLLFLLCIVLAGCSAGTRPLASHGSAIFRVQWPEKTRALPDYSESILIEVFKSSTNEKLKEMTLMRPKNGRFSTVAITDLPLGKVKNRLNAYPPRNVVGIPLSFFPVPNAVGEGEVEIIGKKPAEITITMNSTIARLVPIPSNPDITLDPELTVSVGDRFDLNATPLDRDSIGIVNGSPAYIGTEVLIRPYSLEWSVDNPDILFDGGLAGFTASKPGTAVVTVTEPDSGKQAKWIIHVENPSGGAGGGPCSNCPF